MNRKEMLLALLAEECAEVVQAASKSLRFGLEDFKPGQEKTNAETIVYEFNDALAIMNLLHKEGHIPEVICEDAIQNKYAKVEKYMKIHKDLGTLTE